MKLLKEWTKTLHNTISDPLVLTQKQYLNPEQQKTIDDFLEKEELPEKIDSFL